MNVATQTVLIGVIAAAVLGMMGWSVQRIIGRIDRLADSLDTLKDRVTVIESKQDTNTELAARADRVGRATASKVGVRLPKDLTDTVDPSRLRAAR